MNTISQAGRSFFELVPREIRDQIYDATLDHDMKHCNIRYQFPAPHLHLRLVSHQFKEEYDERSAGDGTLIVSIPAQPSRVENWLPSFPKSAISCTSLRVNYYASRADLSKWDPSWQTTWQKELTYLAISISTLEYRQRDIDLERLDVSLVWNSIRALEDFATMCRVRESGITVTGVLAYIVRRIHYIIYGTLDNFHSPDVVSGLKLQYGGSADVARPDQPAYSVPGAGILESPAVLGTWNNREDCFAVDEEGIGERLKVELAIDATNTKSRALGSI